MRHHETRVQHGVHGHRSSLAAGFSLIEVLVALLILSFGLLGLALLQTTSLKLNTSSYSRSQATLLAYDIIERIRLNPASRASYSIANTTDANSAISAYDSCRTATCNCETTQCSSANLATYDLGKWYLMHDSLLPGARTGERSTIAQAGDTVTVTIRWFEDDLQKEQTWVIEL